MRTTFALVAILLAAPAHACSLQYEDAAGDQAPPAPTEPYDILTVNYTVFDDSLLWSVYADGLTPSSNNVQYAGQIQTPNATAGSMHHPVCFMPLERATEPGDAECRLSVSHRAGNVATFEEVGPLEGRVENGVLRVSIPFSMLGVRPGDRLGDLRATSQTTAASQETAVTPTMTDQAGDGSATMVLCTDAPAGGLDGDVLGRGNTTSGATGERAPPGGDGDPSAATPGEDAPWPSALVLLGLLVLVRRTRRA